MKKLTEFEARYIEGYAKALHDIQHRITGEDAHTKSYDPLTVNDDRATMMSYVFNMKDGGRSHPVSDYESVEEICAVLRDETFTEIAWEADGASRVLKTQEREMMTEEYDNYYYPVSFSVGPLTIMFSRTGELCLMGFWGQESITFSSAPDSTKLELDLQSGSTTVFHVESYPPQF